jgi:hypothetical protein
MGVDNKSPDHWVAYGAASEGIAAASASIAVVGRYWWNLQMQFLVAIGAMRFFKAHWWFFLIVGFLLLAFVLPLGVAFVVSAICTGEMSPRAEDNYIVPLKREEVDTSSAQQVQRAEVVEGPAQVNLNEDVRLAAAIHHVCYLRAIKRDVDDKEFAAAAFGAFDGTVQGFGLELSDLEMFKLGAVFVAGQLKDLGRMSEVDPELIAEVTTDAMSLEVFEAIRAEASFMAYSMVEAMQHGSASSA